MFYDATKVTTDLTAITGSSWGTDLYSAASNSQYIYYVSGTTKSLYKLVYWIKTGSSTPSYQGIYKKINDALKSGDVIATNNGEIYTVTITTSISVSQRSAT